MNVPDDPLERLVGQRHVPAGARLFAPDENFQAVPIEGPIPGHLWRSHRRRLKLDMIGEPHFVTVITLFIPFWAEEGEPLLYEVIVLRGDEGSTDSRHATPAAALAEHARVFTSLQLDLARH